ncbi:MAG: hypothetical protein Edafosvirus2_16 [Edafosvirus sp.]|uniref:Uncharacterized protein n=1 Tax=Edafosvirus sp. TaxID=2487765 RepID=A0A3G4ZSG6_9VIRU|nr:MAG: hypothetical protein Edafosvirus2_16 [Edafosvirus sp.]
MGTLLIRGFPRGPSFDMSKPSKPEKPMTRGECQIGTFFIAGFIIFASIISACNDYSYISKYHEKQMTISESKISVNEFSQRYILHVTYNYNHNNDTIECIPIEISGDVNYNKLKETSKLYPLNSIHKLYIHESNYLKCLLEINQIFSFEKNCCLCAFGVFLLVCTIISIFKDCVKNNSD